MTSTRGFLGWSGKTFLFVAIGLLTLGALYAIGVVLFGEFETFELKVMVTTFIVGGASIGWLCCSTFSGRKRQPILGMAGMALVAAAAALLIYGLWSEIDGTTYWKTTIILLVWAVTVSHFLVLLALSLRKGHWWLYLATGITTFALAALISATILFEEPVTGYDIKLIVVLSILAALGTLVIPILSKAAGPADVAAAGARLTLTEQPDGTFTDAAGKRYLVEPIAD